VLSICAPRFRDQLRRQTRTGVNICLSDHCPAAWRHRAQCQCRTGSGHAADTRCARGLQSNQGYLLGADEGTIIINACALAGERLLDMRLQEAIRTYPAEVPGADILGADADTGGVGGPEKQRPDATSEDRARFRAKPQYHFTERQLQFHRRGSIRP